MRYIKEVAEWVLYLIIGYAIISLGFIIVGL